MESIESGELSRATRRGVINLIPKKGRDELSLKGWRPISILCVDYKLWAKAISNRLETVSPELIGKQQTGFIKGHSIFQNIRKTAEIVALYKKTNKPGIIVLIDFESCFDRVGHQSGWAPLVCAFSLGQKIRSKSIIP